MSNSKELSGRRGFLLGTAAALTAAAIPAVAAEKHRHHHHHHGKHNNLVDAAEECIATGKTCLTHCILLLGEGDSSCQTRICGAFADRQLHPIPTIMHGIWRKSQ